MTTGQYSQLNELLSDFSKLSNEKDTLEAKIKNLQLRAADALLPQHAELSMKLVDLETKLRAIAVANETELFTATGKRTHETPFGKIQFRQASHLAFEDEEKVILKLKLMVRATDPDALDFVRTKEELNLEALEAQPDGWLALLGIRRVTEDKFSVSPFSLKADKPRKEKKEAA